MQTFARPPRGAYDRADFARLDTEPLGPVAPGAYADGALALCGDGSGRITGLPREVWEFAVSGYRVLPRWLDARAGVPADLAFARELRDLAGRIAELNGLFILADHSLDAALAETLTREALGVPPGADADDG